MEKSNLAFQIPSISKGTLLLQYLGQAGFWIRGEDISFLIDPYLSNYVVDSGIGDAEHFSRQFPPPVNPAHVTGLDAVFITHAHADHCDPQTLLLLAKANPQMQVICPVDCVQLLKKTGLEESQIHIPVNEEWQNLGGLDFAAVPSAHYQREFDPTTGTDLYLGYVIRTNGTTLYHSGDTILYEGMIESLQRISREYDIACLPVNGRDAEREAMGIIGNLDGGEALTLTQSIGARLMLPMHNDLFAINHADPGSLASLADKTAPRQRIHWLQPGEFYLYIK